MGNFTSTVDVSNIEDYTRAILSGRRRHGNLKEGCHDHGLYLATRENRHIQGDAELTLNDHLLQRCWPDVVYIAFSNNDIKGQISSDWLRAGLIPPHLEVEIPYRTLLPRGLEGILVVGKALSSSRESLSTIRMQPDFENLGGVVGVAAALAVKSGKTPRQVHIRELQARLTQLGVLPPYILERKLLKFELNEADLIDKIASLRLDQPLHAYSYMELHEVSRQRIPVVDICCAGPQAVTALETALDQEPGGGRRVLIAQMLALLGSQSGVPVLIEAIQRQLADGKLPERDQVIRQVCEYAPDQAAMPDVAYLIYCLGMARDTRALPVWQRIVDLLANTTEEDVTSQPKGIFHYVDAICTGAERLGDPAAIPLLRQLYSYAPFHHQELLNGFQPDYLKERVAYLEVVIGRAMARCSDPQGMVVLINYLNDVRGILAEQAYTEITAISGQDFGRDVARWSHWLEEHGDKLSPVPWVAALEPTKAWKEEILIAPPDEAVIQRVLIYRYKIRGD